MANALAIAAVSAVLKDLLTNAMVNAQLPNEVGVRVGPPLASGNNGNGGQSTQLNLFLYQVMANANWRNECLPTRNGRGDRLNLTPLALNLHYLLTAYSNNEFEAEVILGYAMQLFHEQAILSRGAIRQALSGEGVDGSERLATAGLAEQVELIKISPQYLDTEDMSRLWSSLQANYRTSTAYQVSVVLIEPEEQAAIAPPVINRRVFVRPMSAPVIEQVEPQLAIAGSTITLRGQGLRGTPTQVGFGSASVPPITVEATDQSVEVTLPVGLQAGVNTVQITHPLDLETPTEPHQGIASNVAAFVVQPALVQADAGPPPTYEIAFLPDEAAFNAAFTDAERSRFTQTPTFPAIQLQVTPPVTGDQQIALLLNETPAPADRATRAYSFGNPALLIDAADMPATGNASDLSPENQRSQRLVFSTPGAIAAEYLVRLRVDGADSPLTRAPITNPSDPIAAFIAPSLTVGGES